MQKGQIHDLLDSDDESEDAYVLKTEEAEVL